jgi:hypothetical protein
MATAEDFRRAALALPGVVEIPHFGRPSFRVNEKIFAGLHPKEGRGVLRLPRERQALLFEVRPEVFTPAVWGRLVWTYVRLETVGADELPELAEAAWRGVAPKGWPKA